ncbi:MAG: hypothetical protein AAGH15_02735 [Myxococcota bacterium]
MRTASPRLLILDLLAAAAPASLGARAIVDAGTILGLKENALRVALSRLRAQRAVASPGRGTYVLGPAAPPRPPSPWRAQVAALLEQWDRESWLCVHELGELPGPLRWLGFRPLLRGLSVRPANLRGGVSALRARLGCRHPAFVIRELAPAPDAEALWGVRRRAAEQRALVARLEASYARIAHADPRDDAALAESFRLGGRALRSLHLDPRLPDALASATPRMRLQDAMGRYDERAKALWATRLGLSEAESAPFAREGSGEARA